MKASLLLSTMFAFSRGSYRGAHRFHKRHLAFAVTALGAATAGISANTTTLEHDKEEKEETGENKKQAFSIKEKDDKDFWQTDNGKAFLKEIVSDSQESQTLSGALKNQVAYVVNKAAHKATSMKETVKSLYSNADAQKTKGDEEKGLLGLVGSFTSLVKGGEDRQDALDKLMSGAHTIGEGNGGIQDTAGFSKLVALMQENSGKIEQVLKDQFGHIDFSYFTPTALWYFLEYEDERKNPSWKRLQHRFHKGINVGMVENLNDALMLSDLSYVDTPEQLKEGLEKSNIPLELVYYQMESEPGQPSHFVAVGKGQSWWSGALEVYIVVRGTKTIADAMTDLILEATDYRDGKAHAGIVDSGKWLVDKHKDLLDELLKLTPNKSTIKVTLIGHSLGAGAAAIAGMELNDMKNIDAEVIGFGCPALLSKELSKGTSDYITTVICDSDVVPRMSGATVANAALDIMEYDRYPKLERDAKLAVDALAESYPKLVSKERKDSVLDYIEEAKDDLRKKLLKPKTKERMEPVLFPPGKCVHFYRDGHSISGSIAPCEFFGEIDITRTMIDDHLVPTGYGKIFLDLMRVYKDDEHFQFEEKSTDDNSDSKEK